VGYDKAQSYANPGFRAMAGSPFRVDAVEKVFLHGLTQILRAVGAAIL
jgi:hypothetical protein